MKPFCLLGLVGVLAGGCGPLQVPMADRPDEETQKKIDGSWHKALNPLDRFDHQGLLDLLTVSKGYEVGVDKLTFRSEKRVDAGTVIMEIHYDRLAPAEDRFEVQLVDKTGRTLRTERYDRSDVKRTSHELLVEYDQLRRNQDARMITPEAAQRLAGYEKRMKAIEAILPEREKK